MKIKFISIVHHIFNGKGHELPYQISLSKAVSINGWEFIPLISPDPVVKVFPKEWVSPVFIEHGILDQQGVIIMDQIKKLNFYIFFKSIRKLRNNFLATLNSLITCKSIIFFESFNPFQLLSLLLAIHTCNKKENITLWLLFRGGPNWGGGNFKLISYGFSYSFRLLLFIFTRINTKLKVSYFTDSEILVFELTKFYGTDVKILPIPHTELPLKKVEPAKTKNNLIKVWWPGTPRLDKGSEIIKSFINYESSKLENIMLFSSETNLIDFSLSKINIELLENKISHQKYQNLFYETDVIILPYDKGIYNESTSGIFTEAIFASKITMVTEGTWMSYEYKKYGIKELSFNWHEIDIAKKIREITSNKHLIDKVKSMSNAYREFHSIQCFSKYIKHYYLLK
jgi:hypothetical protein